MILSEESDSSSKNSFIGSVMVNQCCGRTSFLGGGRLICLFHDELATLPSHVSTIIQIVKYVVFHQYRQRKLTYPSQSQRGICFVIRCFSLKTCFLFQKLNIRELSS